MSRVKRLRFRWWMFRAKLAWSRPMVVRRERFGCGCRIDCHRLNGLRMGVDCGAGHIEEKFEGRVSGGV